MHEIRNSLQIRRRHALNDVYKPGDYDIRLSLKALNMPAVTLGANNSRNQSPCSCHAICPAFSPLITF